MKGGRILGTTLLRIQTLRKYTYLLSNLVKKDFTTKYRRSVLGVLWSVLNPLLMMAVISAVFSNILRASVENYPVYYMTGALLFDFMAEGTRGSLGSIIGASGLIKKVYIPKYIFPVEKCLFALINTIFAFIAIIILMPILGVFPTATAFLFWAPMLFMLVFSIGLGMILSALNVFFRDIDHLYGVWLTAWRFLTPLYYPLSAGLPKGIRDFNSLNPMYLYTDYFRQIMMYGAIPSLSQTLTCIALAVGFLAVGLLLFKVLQDKFILYI
jgi:ABC-2 type transport system permease protein